MFGFRPSPSAARGGSFFTAVNRIEKIAKPFWIIRYNSVNPEL
jgi:hypothetical protein